MRKADFEKWCEEYIRNAPPFYGIQFVQSGIETQDVKTLLMWLRRKCVKENLSFYLCDSDIEKPVSSKYVRNGLRGRPKKVVEGQPAIRHVHCMIGSSDEKTDIKKLKSTTSKYLHNRALKRENLKQHKISVVNEMFLVKYMQKQANHEYKYGDFDFDYFSSEWYYRPYEKKDF